VFLLAAQFLWALWARPEARRALVIANVTAAIAYLPWLPVLINHTRSPGAKVFETINPLGLDAIGRDLAHWAIGHPYIALTSVPDPIAIAMLGTACAIAISGVVVRARWPARRVRLQWISDYRALILVLALAMPVGLLLYSLFRNSVWDERNLIASWPGLAVATGALVTSVRGPMRVAAVALVVAGFAISALELLSPAHQRPDYRAAVAFVRRADHADDPIAELPGPSPGPLTEVDAALAGAGPWAREGRPVLRVGQASRASVMRAAPYASLPAPPADVLARRAALLARGERLFVISFGAASLTAVEISGRLNSRLAFGPIFGSGVTGSLLDAEFASLPRFIDDLPRSFQPVEKRTFPGFLPVSVYVFGEGRPNASARLG
jgi:hypothetical protein